MSRQLAQEWPARAGEWTPQTLRYWIAEIERVQRARRFRWWSARDQLMRAHLAEELADKRRRLAALTGRPDTPEQRAAGRPRPGLRTGAALTA